MTNTDREKLVELLEDIGATAEEDCGIDKNNGGRIIDIHGADYIADHLIANGVTFADRLEEKQATSDMKTSDWISVKERLPEYDGTYIVTSERGAVYCNHFYGRRVFSDKYTREPHFSLRGKVKITHWMPPPEPPKEEG